MQKKENARQKNDALLYRNGMHHPVFGQLLLNNSDGCWLWIDIHWILVEESITLDCYDCPFSQKLTRNSLYKHRCWVGHVGTMQLAYISLVPNLHTYIWQPLIQNILTIAQHVISLQCYVLMRHFILFFLISFRVFRSHCNHWSLSEKPNQCH